MMEDINYTYEAKPIDTAVLSVLDVTSDGKIVSAADWTTLWNAVLVRINHIDTYCSNISALAIDWRASVTAFEKAVTDINVMFNALSDGYIHYGDEAPTDEYTRLWIQPSSEVDDKRLVTKGELTTTVNAKTANTIKMWRPYINYRIGDVCFFPRITNAYTPLGAILTCKTNHKACPNLEPTPAELSNWTVYPINAMRSIEDSRGNVIHETYATKNELVTKFSIWQPETAYKVDDLVVTTALGEDSSIATIIAICTQDHTSPNSDFYIDQEESRWDWWPVYSLHDAKGNIIHDHYATKDELTAAIGEALEGDY